MNKATILVGGLICLLGKAKGQNLQFQHLTIEEPSQISLYNSKINNITPLVVGDKVPNLFFDEIFNYVKSEAYLSEFQGKYLILDFWGAFCAPCIAKFPELTLLQEKFSEKLTILPIGIDGPGKGEIMRFIESRKGTNRELKLPSVIIKDVYNSAFVKYFPYTSLPHEVWIDPLGKIIAITGAEAVNEDNIRKVIDGDVLPFKVKKMVKNVAFEDYFLLKPNQPFNKSSYSSAFSRYNDSLFSYTDYARNNPSVTHLRILNKTLTQLFIRAYSPSNDFLKGNGAAKRIIDKKTGQPVFFSDPINMNNWDLSSFQNDKLFCYELIAPINKSKEEIGSIMITDFDKFFQVKSYSTIKEIKCWVLKSSLTGKKYMPENELNCNGVYDDDSLNYYEGVSIEYFINQFNGVYNRSPIIIDRTNINTKITASIPRNADFITLQRHLKQYDLELIEKQEAIPVIMIEKED